MKQFRSSFSCLVLASIAGASLASAATEKVLYHTMRGEPPQLNTTKLTDVESHFVMAHVMEGLTRWTIKDDGSVEPGVAEKWKIDAKGATFNLRKTAKWSDGKPVTAKDFIFAWKTVLKPETASEYAFLLYPMKNAEAINTKGMAADELGAKAVDDYTIQITFEKPIAYFEYLLANPPYFPVREDFYNTRKDKFAAEASDMLFNGPFTLTKWTHGANLSFKKNPNYWNQKLVKLDRIEVPYITPDSSAKYNLFKDGKADVLTPLAKDDLPKAAKDGYKVLSFPDQTIWYLEFNFRKMPNGKMSPVVNKNLRKAIQHAFYADGRNNYIAKVIGIPGTRVANTFVPSVFKGDKKSFMAEHPYAPLKTSLTEAKKYLELAKNEMGGTIPPIRFLTDDTALADRDGQYFQSILKERLGLDLKIDKQIFKQRLAKMTAGDFDIVHAGWGPDFPDVISFIDVKSSWNENNRGHWENAKYDELVRSAMATTDNKLRMAAFADAQKILLEEVGILPTYERVQSWTQAKRVKGVVRRTFGPDPDFTRADVN